MENKSNEYYDLIDIIQTSLDSKFSSIHRRKIDVFSDRINFACPICGDSESDDRKKRGNIFLKTNSYKCFDCGRFYDIKGFLLELKFLGYNTEDIPQGLMLKTDMGGDSGFRANQNISFVADGLTEAISDICIPREEFKKKFYLLEITESKKLGYMRSRCFYEYHRFLYSEYMDKIFILNLDITTDMVISYQERNFEKNSKNRYKTFKLSRMYEEFRMEIPESDQFNELDSLSIYFNITNVNLNRPITYMEGPIDAYLMPNSVSLSSVHNQPPFISPTTRYLLDFDNAGLKVAKKYIKQRQSVFLWRKFLRDYNIQWDDGDKIDYNDLVKILMERKIKKPNLDKYFSSDPMDVIWL